MKSQELSNGLRDSRLKREAENKEFIVKLEETHKTTLDKERTSWNNYTVERTNDKREYMKDQAYLDSLLSTNADKAASRLSTVRRWL